MGGIKNPAQRCHAISRPRIRIHGLVNMAAGHAEHQRRRLSKIFLPHCIHIPLNKKPSVNQKVSTKYYQYCPPTAQK